MYVEAIVLRTRRQLEVENEVLLAEMEAIRDRLEDLLQEEEPASHGHERKLGRDNERPGHADDAS